MGFTVPNVAAAGNAEQAELHEADLLELAAGLAASGVISGCAVTQRAAGANLSVDVAAGTVEVAGTQVAVTSGNVAVAADATNPRYTLIEVDSSGTKSANAGAAAANPTKPTPSASKVVLAEVYIPAAATTIVTARITDKRVIVGLVSIANVMPTAATLVMYSRVTGDTQDRVQLQADGKLLWGSGSLTQDVNFSRSAAGAAVLTMSPGNAGGGLRVTISAAGTSAYAYVFVNNDAGAGAIDLLSLSSTWTTSGLLVANQAVLYTDSTASLLIAQIQATDIIFATGGTAVANERLRIKNSDNSVTAQGPVIAAGAEVRAGQQVVARLLQATETKIGDVGPAGESGIKFSNAGDVNLYRAAGVYLQTDNHFVAGGDIYARTSSVQVKIGAAGTSGQSGISFQAGEFHLFRASAGLLALDAKLYIEKNATDSLLVQSGLSTLYAGYALGRTFADGYWGVAGAANDWFAGTAAGAIVLRGDTAGLYLVTSAGDIVMATGGVLAANERLRIRNSTGGVEIPGPASVGAIGISRAPTVSVTQPATTSSTIVADLELTSGIVYELAADAVLEIA